MGQAEPCSARQLLYQLHSTVNRVKQRTDVCFAAPERLERGNADQRVATQVEDHRVPAGGGDVGAEPAQTFPAEVRPSVRRRIVDGAYHLLFGDQTLHRAARDQAVIEAFVQSDIGVLQVDEVQSRRRPAQVLPM